MRNKIIAGNWKMNLTLQEVECFLKQLVTHLAENKKSNVVPIICPANVYLHFAKAISEQLFMVGAQNVSEYEEGAYTGEVSASMLASESLDYCIIGHSERRHIFGESDEVVNKKLSNLLSHGIKPIICIGETLEEREAGITKQIIDRQLRGAFHQITITEDMLLAYEPVWAIGTGKTATPEQAQEIHSFIRNWLKENAGNELAEKIPILYGGSVKPANIQQLLEQDDIDGGLIGGASLEITSYIQMMEIAATL